MKRLIGLFVSVFFLATSALTTNQAAAQSAKSSPAANDKAVANQYIVVVKNGTDARSVAAVAGISPKYVYGAVFNGFAAELNAGQLNALQHNPNVASIEQDEEISINTTQTVGPGQWGLDRIDQRYLPLNSTYTFTATGANSTAYIISSGIYATHPNFGGRAVNVYDALGGNGTDCHGIGTHTAGIVGSTTYGVAKAVRLRGVRFLDCLGYGTISGLVASLDYVRAYAQKPAAAIITLTTGSGSTILHNAIVNLVNSGVFVTVPAGDNNADACYNSLSNISQVYSATASDRNDYRVSFANYGPCVDIYAPGASITSTWINNGTSTYNSTIVSSAHVLGCVAKYHSVYGDPGPPSIASWLTSTATPDVIRNNPPNTPNRLLYCPL